MVEDLPVVPECRLCTAPLPAGATRCPACGMYRATAVPQDTRWRLVAAMAGLYAVTAGLILLTR
jgi:hypothetical protein